MWNARLDESQAGIKISGRNINNLSYADDTTLMKKMKRNKRPSWWEWKKRVKKLAWNSHSKAKIMASSPITSWKMEGKKVEMVTDFIFLGSKITVDVDYSHEIKRCLLLGRKAMTNLDTILKSRDIILPTKVHLANCGFSSSQVWMWELDYKESWALKNWRFQTAVLEKTLESPLDCKEI